MAAFFHLEVLHLEVLSTAPMTVTPGAPDSLLNAQRLTPNAFSSTRINFEHFA
jgi:hypothetical protein